MWRLNKLKRTIARIDIDKKFEGDDQTVLSLTQEEMEGLPDEGLDVPFLVRQLLDVIPNPWQGMRILQDTLAILRNRGVSDERLYANRIDLVHAMKLDLRQQVGQAAESLFRKKLADGTISLRLVASKNPELNWELAKTLEIEISDDDKVLHRKNGDPMEKPLFEKVYQRDFNTLEKDTAWYLDTRDCVYW